tara:strand:- start:494 stop:733 length:240 start_codon:yes stop_codon:yes gene_type:complete
MQAIHTRYFGATDRRPSRIIATAQAGRLTVSWDHELGVEDNHKAAALAFAARYDWGANWVGGAMPKGDGYAFVCLGRVR